MENIIEYYYNNYNFSSKGNLSKLLKDDGHKIKRTDIDSYLNK